MARRLILAFLCVALLCSPAACGEEEASTPSFVQSADEGTLYSLGLTTLQFIDRSVSRAYEIRVGHTGIFVSKGPGNGRAFVDRYLREAFRRAEGGVTVPPVLSDTPPDQVCEPDQTGVSEPWYWHDVDEDGVPDDWTLTYGSHCAETDSEGNEFRYFTGTIRFQDLGDQPFGFRVTTQNYGVHYTDYYGPGRDFSVVIDGREDFLLTPQQATHVQRTTLVSEQSWGELAEIVDETSSFLPEPGVLLDPAAPLPAGHFQYRSDLRFLGIPVEVGTDDYRVTVSTESPVRYDPTCGTRYTSGNLRGLLDGQAEVGVTLRWVNCTWWFIEPFGAKY